MDEKKRILVLDDDPAVTRVIVQVLERTGLYEVRALNDPADARPKWAPRDTMSRASLSSQSPSEPRRFGRS